MRAGDPGADLTAAQRAAAVEGWKALMPVAGRPFVDFQLSALADAGCRRIALVIGPEQRRAFEDYRTSAVFSRLGLDLVEQPEPLGTANAVWSARGWVGADPFLVMNGDNLYPLDALRGLVSLGGPGLPVFDRDELIASSNIPAERIEAFAIVTLDEAGDLAAIVEKPSPEEVGHLPRPLLVSMNVWRFDGRLLKACGDAPVSPRGEREIPGAVALALSRGVRVATIRARGPVLDLSRQVDVSEVSRRLAGVRPWL